MSIPGIFPPVENQGRLLADIGGFAALPLEIARSYSPQTLFAVDVGSELKPMAATPSALEVMLRMNDVAAALFRDRVLEQADLLIRPDVGRVDWFDFGNPEKLVEAGRQASRASLDTLSSPQRMALKLVQPSSRIA